MPDGWTHGMLQVKLFDYYNKFIIILCVQASKPLGKCISIKLFKFEIRYCHNSNAEKQMPLP